MVSWDLIADSQGLFGSGSDNECLCALKSQLQYCLYVTQATNIGLKH